MIIKAGVLQPPYPSSRSGLKPDDVIDYMFRQIAGSEEKCDLLVLPEYANCPGIEAAEEVRAFADSHCESFIAKLSKLAAARNTIISANLLMKKAGRYRNATFLFDREGRVRGEYFKTHLTRSEAEEWEICAGEEPLLVEINDIRIGFVTCMEIYFSEYAERVASLGPDVIIFPTYQRSEDGDVIRKQVMGRALDMEAFILRSSYSMGEDSRTGGCSLVVNPKGEILVDAGQGTGVFSVSIDSREKRLRPVCHGKAKVRSRQIIEEGRRPCLYRQAGLQIAEGTSSEEKR